MDTGCVDNIQQVILKSILKLKEPLTSATDELFMNEVILDVVNTRKNIVNTTNVDLAINDLIMYLLLNGRLPMVLALDELVELRSKVEDAFLLKKELLPIESQPDEDLQPKDIPEAVYNIKSKTFVDEYYGIGHVGINMLNKFTGDFVKNTLVNFEGNVTSVNSIKEVNNNLKNYLEELYEDLVFYIRSDKNISKDNEYLPDTLFNPDGTNNFKYVYNKLNSVFSRFKPEDLTEFSQRPNKDLIEAINKFFILKHFDLLIMREFSDFLNIGDAYYGKYVDIDDKYTFNTGKDYQNAISWREDEKATPKDVMSKHLWYVAKTIPYYDERGVQHGFLDTDVIIYGLKALKDVYISEKINNVEIFNIEGFNPKAIKDSAGNEIYFSKEESAWIESIGASVRVSDVIDRLRDNPLISYGVLFKIVNSLLFRENNSKVFNQDLINIFGSLYKTVFSNNRVFNNAPDIYLELMHFFDFTTVLNYTLYYLDDAGNWLIRVMNPMNIETNLFTLRNSINSAHASGQMEVLKEKYKVEYNDSQKTGSKFKADKFILMQFTKGRDRYTIKYFPARRGDDRILILKNDVVYEDFDATDYNNFKGFFKDALNINLNRNLDLETEIFRDLLEANGNPNYKLIRDYLVDLSVSVLGNAFIVREKEYEIRDKLDKVVESWGLTSRTKGVESDIQFRSTLGTYNIVGKSLSYNLRWLAERQGIARRLLSKPTMYTAEKTTISSNSLNCFTTERRNLYAHLNEKSAVNKKMLIDLLGWGINREVDLGLTGKQSHNFNFNELLYSNFVVDFLTGYNNDVGTKVCRFMEAVNSDKPNSPRVEVDYNEVFDGTVPKNAEHFYQMTTNTFRDIYFNAWNNLVSDFKTLDLFVANKYKAVQEYEARVEEALAQGLPRPELTYEQRTLINKYKNIYESYLNTYKTQFTIDITKNFKTFNKFSKLLKTTGRSLLHDICLDYNKEHFNEPLALIENVHKRGKNDLELNKAFVTNLMRFNRKAVDPLSPNETPELRNELKNLASLLAEFGIIDTLNNTMLQNLDNLYWLEQQNLNNYFRRNELRLVDDLLTSGAKLDISGDSTESWKQVLNNYIDWSSDGNLVFAKVHLVDLKTGEKKTIKVKEHTDLIDFTSNTRVVKEENGVLKIVTESYTPEDARFNFADELRIDGYSVVGIDVHPLLRSWTAADGYYTGKYLAANVGLTVFSDAKKEKNGPYEEEGAVGDFVKRNVINTATMKLFLINTLNGITEDLTVSVVEDVKALLNNLATDESEYKVWDGCTITNALQHYWENNSLSGSVTGYTKKPIMHYYFDKYAAGYLLKTASFAINNEKMRDSILYRTLHYKTSSIKWRTEDGNLVKHADITRAYDGSAITYDDCYYFKNGKYFNIDKIIKIKGQNRYRVVANLVDEYGKRVTTKEEGDFVGEFVIDNNYDLWSVLGGYDSVSFDRETNTLKKSEYSLLKIANVANKVGIVRKLTKGFSALDVLTQLGLFLYMKHSNIHYIATEGAVKKGAANVNAYKSLFNSDNLNFFKVKAHLFGIQLDAEHEADNAEVSLMTLVISGLADRGFTTDAVLDVYNALGRLAREAILEDINVYKKLIKDKKNASLYKKEIEDNVANEIVKAFKDLIGDASNLINVISLRLSKLKHNDSKKGLIPWSDPSIFNIIVSSVTSTLNKMAIRVKSFGLLSILNPSHDTIQLFNNKKLSLYSSPEKLYRDGVQMVNNAKPITDHNLYLGHYYLYTDNGETKYIKLELKNYYDIVKGIDSGTITDLKETFLGEETEILGSEREKPQFGLYKLELTDPRTKKVKTLITFLNGNIYDPINGLTINPQRYTRVVKINLLGRDLDTYNVFINDGLKTLYDLKSVYDRYQLRKEYENGEISDLIFKQKSHDLLRAMLRDLIKVKNNEEVVFVNHKGESETVKVNNHTTSCYGIFVPMIYKSKFGLRENDNLSDIKEDENFFFKRLLENYSDMNGKAVLKDNYDVIIKRLNNLNIYLITKDSLKDNKNLKEINIDTFTDKNGKVFRIDAFGNIKYQLSSEFDKVYVDHSNINLGEVIVTDAEGIKFYLDNIAKNPFDVKVNKPNKKDKSPESNAYKERINLILKSAKVFKGVEDPYKILSNDDSDLINSYLASGNINDPKMLNAIRYNPKIRELYNKSLRIRTSFLNSLQFLAARIPAQSMLSFMTMKVEGFTNVDKNNCYISDMQVWLLGSDFDIDKVTLMGMAFNNFGELKTWSKYIRLNTPEEFEITAELKFPTGIEIEAHDSESRAYEKYKELFENDKELNIVRPYKPEIPKRASLLKIDELQNNYEDELAEYHRKLRLFVEMINEYSNGFDGVSSTLRDSILDVVNDHNTLEIRDIDNVLMNLILYRATQISKDITNIIPSLNPIDVVSDPLKVRADESNFGRKDIYNRYGNAAVKLKLLLTNQTGKSGIAITAANGIKTFFALTQFYNLRIKKNLTKEELLLLVFDVKIAGKEYHTIANVNKIERDIDAGPELRDEFNLYAETGDAVDADAVISGIMTLATDNAKELKLGKLNASANILGLYLYGVIIGVPFDTLADIFTSNTADVINKKINGNVFTGDADTKLARVITFLKTGPYQPNSKSIKNFLEGHKSIVAVFKSTMDQLKKNNPIEGLTDKKKIALNLQVRKSVFAAKVKEMLDRTRDISGGWQEERYKAEVTEYIKDIYKMYGDGNFERNVLSDIEQLLAGSKEIGVLRSLIVNQGVKVLTLDKFNFYDSFANIILQRLPSGTTIRDIKDQTVRNFYIKNGNSFKIDIIKYVTDEEYKKLVIDTYESKSIKHTINPFRVIENLPHFKAYLDVVACDAIKLNVSSVFKAVRDNSKLVFDRYLVYESKAKSRYYKRMLEFFTRKILDEFLKTIKVKLDDGALIKHNTKYDKANGAPVVTLGTDEGNTAFKLWMESTVIPRLQGGGNFWYENNTFITDLIPKLYTRTVSGNRIRSYSLPIDMIPKTELELKVFDKYLADFENLNRNHYRIGDEFTIADLMFLYNMVTYANMKNTVSLTPITDVLYREDLSIADRYSNFLSSFDSNKDIRVVRDLGINIKQDFNELLISEDELLLLVSPDSFEILDKKNYRGPYVRNYDPETGNRVLSRIKPEVLLKDAAKRKRSGNEDDDVYDYYGDVGELTVGFEDVYELNHEDTISDEDVLGDVIDDIAMENMIEGSGRSFRTTDLDKNYIPVYNTDKTVNKTLGKYSYPKKLKTQVNVLLIDDKNFSSFVEDTVLNNLNSKINNFDITYSYNENENVLQDSIHVDITPKDENFSVKVGDTYYNIPRQVDISIGNRTRGPKINKIMLISAINSEIRNKTNTPC